MDLTEAEDMKKRWQEYTEELYKKDLHDPDNHDGVITHLEPDILECEVKWALGIITMNKTSEGDEIPAELFQTLKDDAMQVLPQYASKFGKLSSGHRTGKGQFSFQFQRIARRDKKAFLSDQCKEIEENNRMGKTRDLFKKNRDTKGTFYVDEHNRGQKC